MCVWGGGGGRGARSLSEVDGSVKLGCTLSKICRVAAWFDLSNFLRFQVSSISDPGVPGVRSMGLDVST